MTSALLVAFSLDGGGAQAVCRAWASTLRSLGLDVKVALIDAQGDSQLRAFNEDLGVSVISPRSSKGLAGCLLWLRRTINKSRPDVIVSLETYPNLCVLICQQASPHRAAVVISEHNVPSLLLRAEGRAKKVQLYIARATYRKADNCVAVSHAAAADLRANFGLSASQVTVLPNPVGMLTERPQTDRTIAANSSSDIELLVPARLVPQKRPDFIIKIAEYLRDTGRGANVRWVGDARDKTYASQFSNDPIFEHQSWSSSWPRSAGPNTIVVLTSAYEGFGNVLVEAAIHGIPSVAGSTSLGCADAICQGVTGELAEGDSIESYAAAILRASKLCGTDMISGWYDQFDGDAAQEKIGRLLRQVIGC